MKKVLAPTIFAILGHAFAQDTLDPAAISWLLVSTAFVFFMVIGLAFFYGGLVRRKNALNTMMMSFVSLGIVGITWAVIGYSLAYAEGGRFVGGLGYFLLNNVGLDGEGVPTVLDFAFQGAFAIITAALISGAIVERMRFGAYMLFITIWSVVIYAPMAKWVWGGGFFDNLLGNSAIDFAGGTVVHINAGIAALVLTLVIGNRKDFGSRAMLPHQVPFTLLGAGILWFGWFGFNGGSAYAADSLAALAMTNTLLAPAVTIVVWAVIDLFRTGKVTAVGLATAVVVGLVAITPAAGVVSPISAILIGAIATFPSYFIITWRASSGLDDSLDVFGAHGVGGITGALLTGIFVSTAWGGDVNGSVGQVLTQFVAVGIAILYSGVGSYLIAQLVGLFTPLRAEDRAEAQGLDVPMHGEEAYGDGEGALLIPVSTSVKAEQVANGTLRSSV
jgi:Amt family ammonium transporter